MSSMDLNQQIQLLIDSAPQDGLMPKVVKAIEPALKLLATQLKHSQYYVVQTTDGNWVMTTLRNRTQPTLEKKVVYAFPTFQDIASGPYSFQDPHLIALAIPVTHILFQMMAIEAIDSTVFFETPGDPTSGTEVRRADLQNLIDIQLRQNPSLLDSQSDELPPDIA